jgi:hypothetical protein
VTAPESFDVPSALPSASPDRSRRRGLALGLAVVATVVGVLLVAVMVWHDPQPAVTVGSSGLAPTPSAVTRLLRSDDLPWTSTSATERVSVSRARGLVAVGPDAAASGRLERLLGLARAAVDAAVRSPTSLLVAYLPASQAAFRAALGAPTGSYPDVAAVTTRIDESQLILLNPRVAATLTSTALRVVVIHEVTHVATDAIDTNGPLWLEEGFADYVAFDAVSVPTKQNAAEAIGWLADRPVPRRWPTDATFHGSAGEARVAYELAWVAVRQLVADYGEHRFVRFYRAVVGGIPLDQAARTLLGTTQTRLEARYQHALRSLADGG